MVEVGTIGVMADTMDGIILGYGTTGVMEATTDGEATTTHGDITIGAGEATMAMDMDMVTAGAGADIIPILTMVTAMVTGATTNMVITEVEEDITTIIQSQAIALLGL